MLRPMPLGWKSSRARHLLVARVQGPQERTHPAPGARHRHTRGQATHRGAVLTQRGLRLLTGAEATAGPCAGTLRTQGTGPGPGSRQGRRPGAPGSSGVSGAQQ